MLMHEYDKSDLFMIPGFCNSIKHDDDKVVMVHTVEVYGGVYSTQWLNGRSSIAFTYV